MKLQQSFQQRQSVHDIKIAAQIQFSIFEIQNSLQQSAKMRFCSISIAANAALPMATSWSIMAVYILRAFLGFVI